MPRITSLICGTRNGRRRQSRTPALADRQGFSKVFALACQLAGTGLNEVDCVAKSCQIPSRCAKAARNRTFALKILPSFLLPCAKRKPDAVALFPNFRAWISSTVIEFYSRSAFAVAISFALSHTLHWKSAAMYSSEITLQGRTVFKFSCLHTVPVSLLDFVIFCLFYQKEVDGLGNKMSQPTCI
jgi:hypothetical protein